MTQKKIELEEDTLYNIIKKKKEIMKTGQVEGFVITFESEKQRKKIIKWKGATQFQSICLTRHIDYEGCSGDLFLEPGL